MDVICRIYLHDIKRINHYVEEAADDFFLDEGKRTEEVAFNGDIFLCFFSGRV